ncbi:MAG: UDP-glucose dehydrogenase family protein [Thermoplasmata archaeon]
MSRSSTSPIVGVDGLGHVGLTTALTFAAKGLRVVGHDIDPRVRRRLRAGRLPFYERGLPELFARVRRTGLFQVEDRLASLCKQAEIIFLCLPTPSGPGGEIDLRVLEAGTRDLGRALANGEGYRVVVVKSTVVPGTTSGLVEPLLREESSLGSSQLGVAANPEFLAEGSMVSDALHPERVIVGTSDPLTLRRLRHLYARFDSPFVALTPGGAELVKYASNGFLAMKVSFANEIAPLAERVHEDVDAVMAAVGLDSRIGPKFLRAGPGFGGSCFDKDLRALVARAREWGLPLRLNEATLRANDDRTDHVLRLVRRALGTIRGRTITVLGLAFKAGTDDVRESRAFPIVRALVARGARVRVHDPVALADFRREWRRDAPTSPRICFCRSIRSALHASDLAVLHADWPQYLRWRPEWTQEMHTPLVVDLRRALRRVPAPGLDRIYLGVGEPMTPGRTSWSSRRHRPRVVGP